MAEIGLPHWTVASELPSTGNKDVDRELRLRLEAIQENFEGIVTQTAKQLEGAFQQRVPAGVVFDTAASSPPPGYLACNGAAVSRSAFADLFSAIGTAYGVGDGSTTFNVPSYNDGRILRGNSSPGGTGGANTHTHAVAVTVSGDTDAVQFPITHGFSVNAGTASVVSLTAHDHLFSGTGGGSADSQSNVPAYRDVFRIIKT